VNIRVVWKHGVAALVAAAFVLPLASAGAAPGGILGLTRVSQDGIVDGMALHRSEVQPSLATDGAKTLVGAFEVGRIFNGGSSAIGWASSKDAGSAWQDGLLPLTLGGKQATTAAGPLWRAADPSAGYDARHKQWLIASTGLNGTGGAVGLFVNGSKDAHKWSAPVVAHVAGTGDAPQNGSLACDNSPRSQGYGNCYLAYNNTGSTPANLLQVVTSNDGGATWSAPAGTPDSSTGTSTVTLVQPPPPGAAPGSTCGRVVVSYTGIPVSGVNSVNWFSSSDCGASWSAHTQILPNSTATHTVAQAVRTGLVVSGSADAAGAIYLTWQTRSFRIAQTTLAAAANAGETNIKVSSVIGMVAGNTLTIDPTGAHPETVTIVTVGTSGATGTGVTFAPALAFAHASGGFVTVNGVPSTSTAAPNDIALSVMPGPTDVTPAPSFGAPARIAIEADTGALTNTVDHFIPAIAVDPGSSGASAGLALFSYFLPLAACQYVNNPSNQCSPQVGYVSSTDGGSTWSAQQALSPGPPSLAVFPRTLALGAGGNGGPDLGNVLGAAVVPDGKPKGDVFGLFPVGIAVNGIDESLYVPKHGLTIGGGS
jgi:hypothetical protein